jgi:hypothetical protein
MKHKLLYSFAILVLTTFVTLVIFAGIGGFQQDSVNWGAFGRTFLFVSFFELVIWAFVYLMDNANWEP